MFLNLQSTFTCASNSVMTVSLKNRIRHSYYSNFIEKFQKYYVTCPEKRGQ